MDERVYPAEPVFEQQVAESGDPHRSPPIMEELKAEARRWELWNLFLPDQKWGAGLSNVDYAPLAELTGRSPIAPEALNCAAPDTGNMEVLAIFGTKEQQKEWLVPLLDGEIRSCFCMSEPGVASSDAANISGRIEQDGDEYVINSRKWWTTGAADSRCKICIFMGLSDPDAESHERHSMILVPLEAPGVTVERTLPVFGYDRGHGECEISFENVRVPASNLLHARGNGFTIAQTRLGPGRVHHCMRAVGMAERALEALCSRALERRAFGKSLAEQGVIQDWIAESRIAIEQTRLLVLKTAWLLDTVGTKAARLEVSAIKVAAARLATSVIDRAIQVHGAAGLSEDFPLASMYATARTIHIVDGPDEVHKMVIARDELRRYES